MQWQGVEKFAGNSFCAKCQALTGTGIFLQQEAQTRKELLAHGAWGKGQGARGIAQAAWGKGQGARSIPGSKLQNAMLHTEVGWAGHECKQAGKMEKYGNCNPGEFCPFPAEDAEPQLFKL